MEDGPSLFWYRDFGPVIPMCTLLTFLTLTYMFGFSLLLGVNRKLGIEPSERIAYEEIRARNWLEKSAIRDKDLEESGHSWAAPKSKRDDLDKGDSSPSSLEEKDNVEDQINA